MSANAIIQRAVELAPIIKQVIPLESAIVISDTEKYIYVVMDSTIDMEKSLFAIGKPLPKKGPAEEAFAFRQCSCYDRTERGIWDFFPIYCCSTKR